jgi:Flp pilus assembly protein TadG
MPSTAPAITSARNLLHRFHRNRQASAAVEFALVAPAFFALLFAILETAIMFFAGQVLESVTQNGARLILTGQAQNSGYLQADFKTQVCGPPTSLANILFDCTNGIYIDVQSYSQFSNITINNQIVACNFVVPTNYSPGGPGDIVVVRVFYQWQMFVTGLGYNISNLCGGKRLLTATAAFQNEPY